MRLIWRHGGGRGRGEGGGASRGYICHILITYLFLFDDTEVGTNRIRRGGSTCLAGVRQELHGMHHSKRSSDPRIEVFCVLGHITVSFLLLLSAHNVKPLGRQREEMEMHYIAGRLKSPIREVA